MRQEDQINQQQQMYVLLLRNKQLFTWKFVRMHFRECVRGPFCHVLNVSRVI